MIALASSIVSHWNIESRVEDAIYYTKAFISLKNGDFKEILNQSWSCNLSKSGIADINT
jgi:hypothetical protein